MTTNRPIHHRFAGLRAGFRAHRSSLFAVAASVVTVLALIQVPVCGMDMDACMLMPTGAAEAPSGAAGGVSTGAACPLAGTNGGMECCAKDASDQAPADNPARTTDQHLQKQPQAPSPDTECVAQCTPCGPDGQPLDTHDGGSAVPEVPLYTLFSSYLS